MLTGALIGVAVALALMVLNKRKAKSGTGLPGAVEAALREHGPMTLKQISVKVGRDSIIGRGNVIQALAALESLGKITVNHAPPGTPQLKKVDVTTYAVV